jgi:O-antigen polysaccharide polymerase Wzy
LTHHALDFFLVCSIGVILLIPLVWRAMNAAFDPFEPLVFFAAAYGVMFVGRPLTMIIDGDYSYEAPLSTLNVEPEFTKMLTLALLGALSFLIGYSLSWGKRLARRHPRSPLIDRKIASLAAGAVAVIGVACFAIFLGHAGGLSAVLLLLRGRTPELSQATADLSFYPWTGALMLVPACLTFLGLTWQRRTKGLIAAFLFTAALVLLLTLPIGNRFILLVFFGAIFLLFYLRRLARPKWLTLFIVGVVAIFAASFLSDLRGRSTRGESVQETLARLASHPADAPRRLVTGPDSEMAPVLSAALSVIPRELPHTYGATIFGDLVARPIPRTIWPTKPEPPRDKLIATLWPTESARGSVNVEFSVLLYFYWDFGMIGVVIGLATFGVGARWLYEYFLRRSESFSAQLIYSLAVWFIVIGLRNGPVETFITGVFIGGPLMVILTIAKRRVAPDGTTRTRCDRALA